MRLNQVTVAAIDLEASYAFYRRLGLKPIVKSPHYARFVCPDGDSTFSIHASDVASATTTVYFECDDLDAAVRAVAASGIAIESGPVDQRWRWREAHLRDPAGNRICLYHAGMNRLHPPWRLADDAAAPPVDKP